MAEAGRRALEGTDGGNTGEATHEEGRDESRKNWLKCKTEDLKRCVV